VKIPLAAIAVSALASTAAQATQLYTNGPINGELDAMSINFGFATSNSFTLSTTAVVTGVDFGAWVFPGNNMSTVDWAITTASDSFPDGPAAAVSGNLLFANAHGLDVYQDSFSITPTYLAAGNYYLVLQKAFVPSTGDSAYWDQNNGPSAAYWQPTSEIFFTCAPIGPPACSESFDITGSAVPEPSTWAMMLLGFAGLGFAGYRRARAGGATLAT
jgi:PEP-CTERM motif